MGRKLNALEEFQTSLSDPDADRKRGRVQPRQQLIDRIAETLGITTAQLGECPDDLCAVRPVLDGARRDDHVLTRQCLDLVEAFVAIQDPQDRLRCLRIVRDAARAKSTR